MTDTTTGAVEFKIDGKTYTTAGLDEITLKDVLRFDTQAAALGLGITWKDVERINQEFAELTAEEADNHPQAVLMVALTIWASRRVAGDDVSLDEAIDIPLSSIDFGTPPEEPARPTQPRKAGAKKGAQKSGNPAKRAASAQPAARAAAASGRAPRKTSASRSAAG
jgi:hypothetical protein